MIKYSDINRYDNLDFDIYRKLPGIGYSALKSMRDGLPTEVKTTEKMLMGSMVDSILTEDLSKIDIKNPIYPPAHKAAQTIKSNFGSLVDKLHKQVSYTANINFEGLVMPTTGRLDFQLANIAVIDLKVTHEARNLQDCINLIKYMQYKRQLRHYGRFIDATHHYILIYSFKSKEVYLISLKDFSEEDIWWEQKVLEHGIAI